MGTVRMSSTELGDRLSETERRTLIDVARAAIHAGVEGSHAAVDIDALSPTLRAVRATFVTLLLNDALRGCIGTLEPFRPLALDVAESAYAAAFRDPRFEPVTAREADLLDIHISILNPPEPLVFVSEGDLLGQLRPGIDGLVLRDRGRSATFLPSVWESVRDPREFLRQLKLKAGLPPDGWSSTMRAERYTVSSIP